MHPESERFWSRYFLVGLVLWAVLAGVFAVYMLAVPHGPNFAVPLGPQGAFVIFGCVYSVGYVGLLFVTALVLAFVRRVWSLCARRQETD